MITTHDIMAQGSAEWLAARCGLLTASEMRLIITPSNLKPAKNDKEKSHLYEILAQRITGYVEPQYISDDMLRGMSDECEAKMLYSQNYAPVKDVGFITNDKFGFTIGYSPDGLVGEDGLIECKSRRQKFQIETIVSSEMPDEYLIQAQTGLLVSERKWLDFVSYSGGLPMFVKRILPNAEIQEAIVAAAAGFEARLAEKMEIYKASIGSFIATERKPPEQEIHL